MAAVFARKPAMRAQSAWWMERRSCCGMITVTGLETVCRHVRSMRSLLLYGKRQPMTRQRYSRKRERFTAAAVAGADPAGTSGSAVFQGTDLLVAADCTAYAYAEFHKEFIRGRVTLVGCPKLDSVDYAEKLTEILRNNEIRSVTVVRMEVPCCGGMENAVKRALQASGKLLPWQVVTISTDGKILGRD